MIHTGDGTAYLVRSEILVELKDGGYFLPLALRDMTPHTTPEESVTNQRLAPVDAPIPDTKKLFIITTNDK